MSNKNLNTKLPPYLHRSADSDSVYLVISWSGYVIALVSSSLYAGGPIDRDHFGPDPFRRTQPLKDKRINCTLVMKTGKITS